MRTATCSICGATWYPKNRGARAKKLFCSPQCRGLSLSRARHPALRETFFDFVDSPEKAYWLGFLFADGALIDARGAQLLRLELANKDEGHLDRFIAAVGASPDAKRRRQYRPGFWSTIIDIGNRRFTTPLVRLGLVPRKTVVVRYPALGTDLLDLAFLLGYFDGDGCVTEKHVTITCGSRAFLEDIVRRWQLRYTISTTVKGRSHTLYLGAQLYQQMLSSYPNSLPRKRRAVAVSHTRRGRLTAEERAAEAPKLPAAGARTQCPAGHPYDELNTRHYRGRRHCRTCARAAQYRYRQRQRANNSPVLTAIEARA